MDRKFGREDSVAELREAIPRGRAALEVTEGCIILEGGAWRGLYTQGALDVLMQEGILFQTTIGISAGAMSGIAYLSGSIGMSARWNLGHRLDPSYFGKTAFRTDHGITGFRYFFEKSQEEEPVDAERFWDRRREFIVGATNCLTGRVHYFRKNSHIPGDGEPSDWSEENSFLRAIAASASVPYLSLPVRIDDVPYLDGSCAVNIPLHLAQRMGFQKIMVLKTQDRSFRAAEGKENRAAKAEYGKIYPNLNRALQTNHERYNRTLDEIDRLEKEGRIFVLAPSQPIVHGNLQKDPEKLSGYYWMGYHDMKAQLPALHAYLTAK